MNKKRIKRAIGLVAGILVFLIVNFAPLSNIEPQGQTCLALTLMTVVWWATQIAQPAYVGGIYLLGLILLGVAPPELVLKPWTGSIMWLVIGAYLIAGAVKESGLGERIAYWFIMKFVRSWKGLVVAIFIITFILALLIPHPFPRAFLILTVMLVVCDAAKMSKADKIKIGFMVFAAAAPCSMFFLTGDAVINPLCVEQSGVDCGFIQWFIYMSVPMLVAAGGTLLLGLFLFKPEKELDINFEEVQAKRDSLGNFSEMEIRTVVWLIIAILLWLTDTIHGINIGWVTLLVALFMSLPVVGEVLTPDSWKGVPIQVLIFLTSAMAIGIVGGATGMNQWVADTVLPSSVPTNIFVLTLMMVAITIVVHMVMGSVIAVMGICIPAFLYFTAGTDISPLAVAMIVYSAINIHYILPFHNLAILVGVGEENAGYTSNETIKMGVPLTIVVFLTGLAQAAWFSLFGLM